jgi:hypothetical protein
VLFDADDLALAGAEEDLIAGVVLCNPRPVHVIVNGEFVVRDGHLVRADLHDIASAHRLASAQLLKNSAMD